MTADGRMFYSTTSADNTRYRHVPEPSVAKDMRI
jgi:hypothetical protein